MNRSEVEELLRSIAGPSPWYLRDEFVMRSEGTLTWKEHPNGVTILTDESDRIYMAVHFGVYFLQPHPNQALVWYIEQSSLTAKILLIDIDSLNEIEFSEGDIPDPIQFDGNTISEFSFACSRPGEEFDIDVPAEFSKFEELILIGEMKPFGDSDQPSRGLFITDLVAGHVKIVPQDWYNKGNYDFGYQWITRVARDPVTKKLFGEGIRLGFFQLDDTGRQVQEWL